MRGLRCIVIAALTALSLAAPCAEAQQSETQRVETPRELPGATAQPAAPTGVFAAPPAAPAQAPAPAAPAASGPRRIVVIGDSLADAMAVSLVEAVADMKTIVIDRRAKADSGLVRDDLHDWNRALAGILNEGSVAAVVVLMGSNDRQPIQAAQGSLRPRTQEWRAAYANRVDALLEQAKAKGATVYWMSLPPMQGRSLAADMALINDIVRERVERAGAKYIDVWNAFADEEGGYIAFGPDISGVVRRLRTGDGVHFTKAGNQKLAHFVQRELRRDFGGDPDPSAPAVAAVSPPGASIKTPLQPGAPPAAAARSPSAGGLGPQAALPPGQTGPSVEAGKPGSAADPGNTAKPQTPPADPVAPPAAWVGPVIPLTGESGSDTAGLAGGQIRRPGEPNLAEQALRLGRTPPPKAGRGDDFHWPEPRRP